MAVEITISQVNEKMQYLLARSEIMYLPILRTRVNGSIKFLEDFLKFLEDLEDGQGNTSTTNDWKTELREVVYPIENAVDSFLVRTGLTRASPILYVKSLSGQIVLNNKMKKIVDDLRKMSKQIPEMSGKSDGGDHEQGKALEDMGVPSSNNLRDSQLQQSDTSEPYISNGRPESDQEQPKLSEDTWVQPTDLPSNNLGDVGEVTSEQNMSDGRPSQEQTKLPQTDLSSNLRDVKDMGAPGMSEIKEVADGNHTVGQQILDRSLPSTSSNLGDEIKIAPGKRLQRSGTLSLHDETKNAPGKHLRRSETFYDETKVVVLKDKLQELSQLTLNHYAMYFIISVVGRAGSGKTLLVRQIFNQSQTRQNFDKLVFISVSQNFKEREILAEILQQVAGVKDQEKLSFEVLQQKLRDFLARKRYLIVLDDVHTPDVWNKIKLAFPKSKGSRVILTIRDANVARRIAPSIVLLHIRPLTDDESWILFSRSVKKDISTLQENLKREILDKCQGLPLQILVLGGVLASRENPAEWSKVLNQIKAIGKEEKKRAEETKLGRKETMTAKRPKQGEIQAVKATEHVKQKKQEEKKETNAAHDEDQSNSQDQLDSEDSLDPSNILALGFQDLSSKLRECFHYLCLFPKSYEIRTRRLFQLWFAGGLAVIPKKGGSTDEGLAVIPRKGDANAAEDAVERYIEDLLQRNMIEVGELRSDGKPKTCRVLDTLYDKFILYAAGLGYHHIYGNSDSTSNSSIRWFAERLDLLDKLPDQKCIQDVRSFICFYKQEGDRPAEEVENFINKTLIRRGFGLLTVLDLEGVYKPVLPKTLGKVLPLLKYVGLRWTFLDSIPGSVGDLHFLETLDVKHTNITTLPISIWKAKELQHLYMNEIHFEMSSGESSSCDYPKKLQTLWGLLIGNRKPPTELLNKLESIRKLGLTCHSDSLKELTDWVSKLSELRSLRLRAINEFSESSDIHLKPMNDHKKLTDLYLLGKLPRAIVKSELPPNLTNLTLSVSQLLVDPMEMLGQLAELKVLKLLAGSYIGKDMTCLQGGFPKLEVLKLWMLKELENWNIQERTMPELKELEIRYCPKLKKPEGLKYLTAAFEKVTLTNMDEAFITEVEGCLSQKAQNISIQKTNHVFNPSWN
ncbi:hypothetical protein EZV62_001127 [Acer yangbiense]|uniref:AAA+ ATPase domain-containing protein n=1 Tax=Acer yangbiense TaxID=1000413 RepID=A0A5C7ITW7_9ROSI|nr:hypothetical protein EZV62_001127 [Acer yangbiense]